MYSAGKMQIYYCQSYCYLKLLPSCKTFKTLYTDSIAVDVFCLQAQIFCLATISQPFIHCHSVGNCFCRLEERKFEINKKT